MSELGIGPIPLPFEWIESGELDTTAPIPFEFGAGIGPIPLPFEWIESGVVPPPPPPPPPILPVERPQVDFDTWLEIYCPGLVPTREIVEAVASAYQAKGAPLVQGEVLAAVLPLIPDGNAPQYTLGAPPEPPLLQPRATPVFAAALPQFPTGLPRFRDSNPDPMDGWAVDSAEVWQ